ncbi:Tudor/PWWP/MBT superfamily protein [Corchorus olitorius]|uniref:Tudor/PWWP/MBT superfamily protein n=1 Tax=Corchorus olitorius TaxID=93759 RepID=A0A1R3JUR1_9ROSI|nr:Tudor/PWWP/MBT superfamily protein [Corchorus olitorius]
MRTDGWTMKDRAMVHGTGSSARRVKYEVGDMVWGKVQSHPWWPGQIYDEALVSPIVKESKIEGHLLVAFFGDDTYGWFDPTKLIPFEPNYMEKSKQTNARDFMDAVADAENETRRRAALGLSCFCRNPSNFKAVGVRGFFQVDVRGYGHGAVYTAKQIKSARDGFQPTDVLNFLKGIALMPCNLKKGVDWLKKEAMVLAYRRAVFKELDEPYFNSFGVEPEGTSDSSRILALQEKLPSRASLSCPPESPQATARRKCLPRPTETKKKRCLNESDISGVHSDQGLPQNSPIMSIYKKVVIGGNVMQRRAPSGSLRQQKLNKKFDSMSMTLSQEDINEATAMNKKPVRRKISSMNLMVDREHLPQGLAKVGNLDDLQAVDNALPPSGVISREKFLVTSSGHVDEQPSISNQLEKDLTSKEAGTVNKRKRKTEFKLDESSQKRCKTVKAEASERSKYGNSCQTGLGYLDNNPSHVDSQEVPSASKPPKKRLRPDDYEMFGQNNSDSSQNEGMPEKKKIKPSKLKSFSAEKEVCHQKPLKSLRIHNKEGALTDPTKKGKNLIKKSKPSTKAAERTVLVMQFPLKSALPSVSELKARFSRFGPLDSLPKLFWKSSTCRITFKYKSDASVAYRYASGNKSLFGNAMVNCYLHALEVPALEVPKPCQDNAEENLDNLPWSVSTGTGISTENLKAIAPEEQQHLHSLFQPKSCLKKSEGEELVAGTPQMKPRVRFRLNEDQSSSREQVTVNSNVINSSMNQLGGSSLPCYATAGIPGNWQVNNAQLPPALHPLLNQTTDTLKDYGLDHFVASCNARYEAEARNNCIYSPSTSCNVDISSQMLNLMTRCSEIVSNLKGCLGYVPINL